MVAAVLPTMGKVTFVSSSMSMEVLRWHGRVPLPCSLHSRAWFVGTSLDSTPFGTLLGVFSTLIPPWGDMAKLPAISASPSQLAPPKMPLWNQALKGDFVDSCCTDWEMSTWVYKIARGKVRCTSQLYWALVFAALRSCRKAGTWWRGGAKLIKLMLLREPEMWQIFTLNLLPSVTWIYKKRILLLSYYY